MSISAIFSSAVDIDSTLSGQLTFNTTGLTGDITLDAKVSYSSTGGTYTTTAVAYDGVSVSSFIFTNGTTMSVDQSTGLLTYTRLSGDAADGNPDTYSFEFILSDGTTTDNCTASVTTQRNITITNFTATAINDITPQITGTIDISVLKDSNATISVGIAGIGYSTGAAKSFRNTTAIYTWTFANGSTFSIDTGSDTWTYIRPAADVGNLSQSTYTISVTVNDGKVSRNIYCTTSTTVTYPPSINAMTVNAVSDTDSAITGTLTVNDAAGSSVGFSVSKNGYTYTGAGKTFASNLSWTYSDGSVLAWNTATGAWSYTRATGSVNDNTADVYVFYATLTNTVGNATKNCTVTTVVPKATINTFSAGTTLDTEDSIVGVMDVTMPTTQNNPTIQVDVTKNGTMYIASAVALTGSAVTFTYPDNSTFKYTPQSSAFSYTREASAASDSSADTYVFDVTIIVNNQTTKASLVAKTLAGKRVYSYETAYPIRFAAGNTESNASAWPKVILEFERVYRLLNDNMNYYENIIQELKNKVDELDTKVTALESSLDDKLDDLDSRLASAIAGVKTWTTEQLNSKIHYFGNYSTVSTRSGTAASDGFFIVYAEDSKNGHTYFYVNGDLVGVGNCGGVDYGISSRTFVVPVKKGDSWSVDSTDNDLHWIKFFSFA